MAELIKGAPVAASIDERTKTTVEELKARGITPTFATLRVGERGDDIAYERGAGKKAASVGLEVRNIVLPADITQEQLMEELDKVNKDTSIHGVLVFRPLPAHLDGEAVRLALDPAKDIDGMTDGSLAGVFTNTKLGFPPCTAQAVMEILKFQGIELQGKNVTVIGHSLVVGRPLVNMLLWENATVTCCHVFTVDTGSFAKKADILVAAAGVAGLFGEGYFAPGQTCIDVGITMMPDGKLSGDFKFDIAEPIVDAITPVPGGVGSVTTSVLVGNVAVAALRQNS